MPCQAHRVPLVAILLVVAAACGLRSARDDERGTPFVVSDKSEKTVFTTPEQLAALEAPNDLPYQLAPGDVITIDVWGQRGLSGKHLIGPDGRITLPVAGAVGIAAQSIEQAAGTVNGVLGRYFKTPAATVRVEKFVGNRVTVLGRVENPGIIRFEGTPTLLEALARAGGLPVLDKNATLTRCAIFRGRERVLWVDLQRLLADADLRLNVRLQPNDLVYIPDSDDTLVYVLGEVEKPGSYRLTPDMSFLDALATAGGPTKDASPGRIELIRLSGRYQQRIDFGDFRNGDAAGNIALEEGDIIFVPRNTLAQIGYVFGQLSPITSFLLLMAL